MARLRRIHPLSCVAAIGIALLVATLVPLVLISAFNHSYADDWHYGVWSHLALKHSGNIFAAIGAAFEQVGKAWFDWQGTYSAIFLMSIQPGIFGEQVYVIAAPLIMLSLIAGTFFFTHTLIVEVLGGSRRIWVGLSSLMVAVELVLQPSPVEGIFWYNSAIYYTTYHAAALALIGIWVKISNPARLERTQSRPAPRRLRGAKSQDQKSLCTRPVGLIGASVLFSLFVAGGNFVTALWAAEVMVVILITLIIKGKSTSLDVLPSFGAMLLGLVVSLAAPGNGVRQQTQFPGEGAGVIGTIWQSSLAAFQYFEQWTEGLVVLLVLFSIPLALYVCEKAIDRGWRFRMPGLVVVASMALFATSFTPTFWAQGTVGPGRVQNCRFDLFITLLILCVFWCCGWLCVQIREWRESDAVHKAQHRLVRSRYVATVCALVALVGVCTVGSMAPDKDLSEKLSSVSAARSLVSGKAEAYHKQVLDRYETIENSTESSLRVPFYTNVPHVLLMGDIRDNMDNYINYRLSQWFEKDSIVGFKSTSQKASS